MNHPVLQRGNGSRRSLLHFLLGLLSGLVWDSPPALAESVIRQQIVLRDGWFVRPVDEPDPNATPLIAEAAHPGTNWLAATMPAQVQELLLARGRIADPRIGHNCTEAAWIPEKHWAYATAFVTPRREAGTAAFVSSDGLDTLAAIHLNGHEVGRCADMFRRYRFDVRAHLKPAGETNQLLILFRSPLRFLNDIRRQLGDNNPVPAFKYFRKCESEFSNYLGHRPHFIKVGLFRDVVLDLPGQAWFGDPCVRSSLSDDWSRAKLHIVPDVTGAADRLRWTLTGPGGEDLAHGERGIVNEAFDVALKSPRLWWPHTHGDPALHTLRLELFGGGHVLDAREIRFGIRKVEPVLRDPVTRENRFAFKINGRLLYLRGGCWAQLDNLSHVWDTNRCNRILDLAVHGNMNVLRVWGEGVFPADHFYEECDRRGILVWQDFMTGHGMRFPLDYPGYRQEMAAELVDVIKRLRNHPSIFLWCGGNEHYLGYPSRSDQPREPLGRELLEEIMPRLVKQEDPGRFYHPSSPWGGLPNGNDPLEGDWHDYSTIRWVPNASVPLYISELCQVSPPSLASMKRFMSDSDLWPPGFDYRVDQPGEIAWPPEWEYHSSGNAWEKVGRIEDFCEPRTAADLIRVIGTAHGEYLQQRVERIRRGVPDGAPDGNRRCWGSTLWRLNDPWPMIYMSALDYYLEPKIAYYYLRRAYTPVLPSFEQANDRIHAWVINDSPRAASGRLVVQRLNFAGKVIREMGADVTVAPGQSKRALDTSALGEIPRRSEFLAASFNGQTSFCYLIGERHLKLPRPNLQVARVEGGVRISTDVLAKQVALEAEAATGVVFEDNFFDLLPGQVRTLRRLYPAGAGRLRVTAVNASPVELDL